MERDRQAETETVIRQAVEMAADLRAATGDLVALLRAHQERTEEEDDDDAA